MTYHAEVPRHRIVAKRRTGQTCCGAQQAGVLCYNVNRGGRSVEYMDYRSQLGRVCTVRTMEAYGIAAQVGDWTSLGVAMLVGLPL